MPDYLVLGGVEDLNGKVVTGTPEEACTALHSCSAGDLIAFVAVPDGERHHHNVYDVYDATKFNFDKYSWLFRTAPHIEKGNATVILLGDSDDFGDIPEGFDPEVDKSSDLLLRDAIAESNLPLVGRFA